MVEKGCRHADADGLLIFCCIKQDSWKCVTKIIKARIIFIANLQLLILASDLTNDPTFA